MLKDSGAESQESHRGYSFGLVRSAESLTMPRTSPSQRDVTSIFGRIGFWRQTPPVAVTLELTVLQLFDSPCRLNFCGGQVRQFAIDRHRYPGQVIPSVRGLGQAKSGIDCLECQLALHNA